MREIRQITSHGQVLIPNQFRLKYGIRAGDSLLFIAGKNGIFIKKVESPITMQEIVERAEKDIKNGNTVTVNSREELEELINEL